MIVPDPEIAVAVSVKVILSVVLKDHVMLDAVPFCWMSFTPKLDEPTALENTTEKLTGAAATGSACEPD
jgi:hypothetical protein